MKKENNSMDLFRTHVKKITTVCFFLLLAVVVVSMMIDGDKTAMPIAVVLLLVLVAIVRMCQDSVVEIVIRKDVAEMEFFDKSRKKIPMEDIVIVKESSSGQELILSNKKKLRVMKRPVQITVYNEGNITHKIRQEDFPDAKFMKAR